MTPYPGASAWLKLLFSLALLTAAQTAPAAPLASPVAHHATGPTPRLAIVIDDVGHSDYQVERVLALPGPLTLGVLPHTPAALRASHLAAGYGKEIILHQPMQNLSGYPLGPGGLDTSMGREQFVAQLDAALAAVPNCLGVSNHTGSLLTQSAQRMHWLMEVLAARNLFFLDSRTTPRTVAFQLARQRGVPAVQRDVFLDHDPTEAAMQSAFERAIQIARQNGRAVIIAHPFPQALRLLAERLPALERRGIRQVLLSDLMPANSVTPAGSIITAGAD